MKNRTVNTVKHNRAILKKVLLLLLSFAIQFGIYIGISSLGVLFDARFYTIGFTVYLTLGATILVLYYVLNGGSFTLSSNEQYAVRRKHAKRLHYILLPMAVILLIVFADMYFGESVRNIFG